jgi:hypothetical protein
VHADLSTASGWHTRIPLVGSTSFTGGHYRATVVLDLLDLDARAHAAAVTTGIPSDQLRVSVAPDFLPDGGAPFSPRLNLTLTPLQLTLTEGSPLVVESARPTARTVPVTGQVRLFGTLASVAALRLLALLLVALGSPAAVVTVLLARRGEPASEGLRIQRRHAAILLAVQPMPSVPGRAVVDVAEFTALVRIAERYGLLILHWVRSGVETYLVQDEGTTYRYRTASLPEGDVTCSTTDAPSSERAWSM